MRRVSGFIVTRFVYSARKKLTADEYIASYSQSVMRNTMRKVKQTKVGLNARLVGNGIT